MSDTGLINVTVSGEGVNILIDKVTLKDYCTRCGCSPLAIENCIEEFGLCKMCLHLLPEREYTVL